MFNVQVVPEGSLPKQLPHVAISMVGAAAGMDPNRLVTLDELISDSRFVHQPCSWSHRRRAVHCWSLRRMDPSCTPVC